MALKYKVGDRIKIKSIDWYNKNKNKRGNISFPYEVEVVFTLDKSSYCGQVVTISKTGYTQGVGFYRIKEDYGVHMWTDEMIEGLVEEEEIEFTEEDKYWCDIMSESDPTTYVLPDGYIFKDENGNVINATKIVLEKKKKEYPKRYEECCYVLGFENTEMVFEDDYRDINPPKEQWKRLGLMNQLNKLLICRDAYWKIAGDEMGLGKPWKSSKDNMVYSFYRHSNEIETAIFSGESVTFEFPTEEMRNAFLENFKDLLESIKELL